MQCVQAKQAQELLFYGNAQRKGLVASQVRLLKAHTLNQMQSKWLVTLRDTFMDHHTKALYGDLHLVLAHKRTQFVVHATGYVRKGYN